MTYSVSFAIPKHYNPPLVDDDATKGDYNDVDLTDYLWKPQPGKQQLFYDDITTDIILYGGAAGSGKTQALLIKLGRYINIKGYVGKIFRETAASEIKAEGGLEYKSKQVYTDIPGSRYNETDLVWSFSKGSTISFGHTNDLEKKHLGSEMAIVGIDEAANWQEKYFWFLLSRNRTDAPIKPQILLTCNPNKESFLLEFVRWYIKPEDGIPRQDRECLIRYFYRVDNELIWAQNKQDLMIQYPKLAQIAEPRSFRFIPGTVQDNPIFLSKNPEYVGNLLSLDTVERDRLLYGSWLATYDKGKVFSRHWFEIVDKVPARGYKLRFWDMASTDAINATNQSFYTASQKWLIVPTKGDDFEIYILDCTWEQVEAVEELDDDSIIKTAMQDTSKTYVGWEMEGGSAGKRLARLLTKKLRDLKIKGYGLPPLGNKLVRAKPWALLAQQGKIKILVGSWNDTFLSSVEAFYGQKEPLVTDIVDAGSGCYALYVDELMGLSTGKVRSAKSAN